MSAPNHVAHVTPAYWQCLVKGALIAIVEYTAPPWEVLHRFSSEEGHDVQPRRNVAKTRRMRVSDERVEAEAQCHGRASLYNRKREMRNAKRRRLLGLNGKTTRFLRDGYERLAKRSLADWLVVWLEKGSRSSGRAAGQDEGRLLVRGGQNAHFHELIGNESRFARREDVRAQSNAHAIRDLGHVGGDVVERGGASADAS